ncbi:hypothetical protein V3331_14890 [Gaopeijia maritima]
MIQRRTLEGGLLLGLLVTAPAAAQERVLSADDRLIFGEESHLLTNRER